MKQKQFKIAEEILALLKQNNYNLSTAESCSGGGIAKALTDVPGCSESFVGGVVAYSNDIKCRLLGVDNKTLEKFGAVSKETVTEMAGNIANLFDTDFCIASSGVAGPSGGTFEKPVGTVWLAVATPEHMITLKYHFTGTRERIREQTITKGLELLNEEIQNYID